MGQHAQASLFLILSVLIVTITGVFFAQPSELRRAVLPVMSEAGVVREIIAACLSQSAREAASGFYLQDLDIDLFPLIESGEKIVWWPVWYDKGRLTNPVDVHALIADYASMLQSRCTSVLQDVPILVRENGISTEVHLDDEGVRFILRQSVVVGDAREQILLDDVYEHNVELRVKAMLDVASGILDRIKDEPDEVPVEFMIDQAITQQLKVTYAYLDMDGKRDSRVVVYRIEDLLAGQQVENSYLKFIARVG